MAKEKDVKYRLAQMVAKAQDMEKMVRQMEADFNYRHVRLVEATLKFQRFAADAVAYFDEVTEEMRKDREKELLELRAKVSEMTTGAEFSVEDPAIAQASTIAIFDSIIFAIENWSSDGDTAPDFSLACQAVLFSTVYEPVMSGNTDYELKRVPFSAIEVVRRGREYVKYLRTNHTAAMTDPGVWNLNIKLVSDWWINDALPLLYGARDEAWERSSILSLEDIIVWRDQPASRALQFPLVFDAMDLVDRFGNSIRDTTGLPEFTKQTIDTRLESN